MSGGRFGRDRLLHQFILSQWTAGLFPPFGPVVKNCITRYAKVTERILPMVAYV